MVNINHKILGRGSKLGIFVNFGRLSSNLSVSNWNIATYIRIL